MRRLLLAAASVLLCTVGRRLGAARSSGAAAVALSAPCCRLSASLSAQNAYATHNPIPVSAVRGRGSRLQALKFFVSRLRALGVYAWHTLKPHKHSYTDL